MKVKLPSFLFPGGSSPLLVERGGGWSNSITIYDYILWLAPYLVIFIIHHLSEFSPNLQGLLELLGQV